MDFHEKQIVLNVGDNMPITKKSNKKYWALFPIALPFFIVYYMVLLFNCITEFFSSLLMDVGLLLFYGETSFMATKFWVTRYNHINRF